MGTGWRRAFCTTISRDQESKNSEKQQRSPSPSPSPRSCTRLGFFSGGSNPSTPRLQSQSVSSTQSLRCRTNSDTTTAQSSNTNVNECPKLKRNTTATPKTSKSPRTLLGSNPTSPRSPLKLSLFKNSFKFRSSCGICLNSVKTGQGTAIYTAECSHAFHFPCIAAHVRKHGSLVCPVCNCAWKDVPLLAIHKNLTLESHQEEDPNTKPKTEEIKKVIESSPRATPKPKHETVQQPKLVAVSEPPARSYDDDEPLLTPTAGTRIIPIPEADEDAAECDDDDVEEFQGFFVNPNPSCSAKYADEAQISGRDLRNNVQVRLLPEAAVVSVGSSHQSYAVALRVKAPPATRNGNGTAAAPPLLGSSNRAPVDLVAVLDASGSMTGAKLQMLKRAMRLVISSLGSVDRLCIVAFSSTPKRLLPLRRMTAQGQRTARRIVDRLVCGQGSSVGEALRKATKVLEDRRERNPVASIVLLSDGQDDGAGVQPNSKNQRQASSHVSSTRFAHVEIPVHAFGFGKKSGYSHDLAEEAFAKCVGGLLSVVVQDLRVQLSFPTGTTTEIAAIYSCNGKPAVFGSGSVRLGDLYAEEERELLVELRVPTSISTSSAESSHHVMCVRCLYRDPATQEVVYGREQALLVPPPLAVRSSGPKIERLRNLFILTRAIAESRRLVDHGGDYTSAHHLLASSRALLLQSSLASSEEYVRGLEAELAELHWRRQHQLEQQMMIQRRRGSEREIIPSAVVVDENGDPLTPTSAWRAAEKLAKVAQMKKSLNRVSDLHGFENARF
ncbi:Cdk-activating kinase assembly factor [Parasponia andersonii]|uniref:RING-type E3 ubiquitin transferase n=1 Tax=Parasponia andersonii TaxID=3476 RepID=A0A2P5CF68_PARAD|nr:Cdk-activating kinase assembly factor [Parasponia andersonii]